MFVLLKEFIEDIRLQKTRAFLTTIAIAWGTVTLVILMAFGSGLSFRMREGLLNAGDRIIVVYGGQTTKEYQGLPVGRRIRLTEYDCEILRGSLSMIEGISPVMGHWSTRLQNGDRSALTYMEGVYPSFECLRRMYPIAGGRFLNENDLAERKRVVFLGSEIARELFGKEKPIGKKVSIDGIPFTVVGSLPKKMQTSMNNGPDDRRAIIPMSTFQSIYGYRYLNQIIVKPVRPEDSKLVV
ncbi:MAG: ABC transporter permease, partial [Candidatus Neomarinimicrobiota bacterium]